MPRRIPFTATMAIEATVRKIEMPSHRWRFDMKSIFGFLRTWSTGLPPGGEACLDAERFDLAPLSEHEVEEHAGHEDRGEHRDQQTDGQRHGEALHGAGAVG